MKLSGQVEWVQPWVYADLTRVGSACDGGYVVPQNLLVGIDALISFGVSVDWNFEKDIRRIRPDIPIHCYDHTVGAKLFLKHFMAGCLGFLNGSERFAGVVTRFKTRGEYKRFFSGRTRHFASRIFNRHDSAIDATVDDVFERIGESRHALLKMDIEGGEYRVIPDILGHADKIDIMIIEFHDTDPLRAVFAEQMRLLSEHFHVAHVHGNNYCGRARDGLPDALEMTLVNRRLGQPSERRTSLPLAGLDSPCNPGVPELAIAF